MIKFLLNLGLLLVVAVLVRRTIRGWKSRSAAPPHKEAPRREAGPDLGQGQKIDEAEYEDLP